MTTSVQSPDGASNLESSVESTTPHMGTERWRRTRLFGLALLLVAESMIFVPLFAIRFLLAGTDRPPGLDLGMAAVLTVAMLASFAAMYAARRASGVERWSLASVALSAAALLGLLTAAGAMIGWHDPALDAATGFGGIFYLATGAHVVHLLIGSAFLAGLAIQARRGLLGRGARTLVDATYWFWVFLVVLWLAIDVIFYLV